MNKHIYIYIYRGWVQVTSSVTLNNVTLPNNLLLNSYLKNFTLRLYIFYTNVILPDKTNNHSSYQQFVKKICNSSIFFILKTIKKIYRFKS